MRLRHPFFRTSQNPSFAGLTENADDCICPSSITTCSDLQARRLARHHGLSKRRATLLATFVFGDRHER